MAGGYSGGHTRRTVIFDINSNSLQVVHGRWIVDRLLRSSNPTCSCCVIPKSDQKFLTWRRHSSRMTYFEFRIPFLDECLPKSYLTILVLFGTFKISFGIFSGGQMLNITQVMWNAITSHERIIVFAKYVDWFFEFIIWFWIRVKKSRKIKKKQYKRKRKENTM